MTPRGPSAAAAPAWAAPVGAALVLGLATLDIAWGGEEIVTATVAVGPFLAALGGRVTQTAAVGVLAVLVALLSGVWNDNLGAIPYVVRVLVVMAGAGFAVESARSRTRLARDERRFRTLSEATAIGDGSPSTGEAIARVRRLLVPEVADACEVELREPSAGAPPPDVATADDGHALHVPLVARRTAIGTLRLRRDPGSAPFAPDDAAFAQVFGGRVALALDNAGLVSTVASLEARQTAALGSLDEAVTIQDRTGRLVFANAAAARDLGFTSVDELMATPLERIADRFVTVKADGTPLTLDELPGRRVLLGEAPEPLLVRAVHRETGEERWRRIRATGVPDPDGRVELAVNVIEDVTDVKRAELAQRFLAEASVLLASSLDHEETLVRVARLAVPQLADWCGVSLPDDQGYLRSVAVAHADPEKVELARDYNRRFATHVGDTSGSAQVMRDGASQLVNDIGDAMLREAVQAPEQLEILRRIGMRAAMVVPLVAARGVIGVMTFISAESGRRFTQADLDLAEELGRRAGTAVDNSRLYTERSFIARTLQASLLPDALPEIPGFEIASLYRPAGEENFVGGDFYDAFATPAGWMVVVGDVTGRGAAAAALTGQARHTLRTAARLLGDPVAAVAELNRALVTRRDLPICTVTVVLLAGDGARVVCAGHPPPLRVRDGVAEPVCASGPMVGAWADGAWTADAVELVPDDLLVLYTDGVLDARGTADRFGADRLAAALRDAADAGGAVRSIDLALQDFERGAQADDTAIVAVRRRAAGEPAGAVTSAARRASGAG